MPVANVFAPATTSLLISSILTPPQSGFHKAFFLLFPLIDNRELSFFRSFRHSKFWCNILHPMFQLFVYLSYHSIRLETTDSDLMGELSMILLFSHAPFHILIKILDPNTVTVSVSIFYTTTILNVERLYIIFYCIFLLVYSQCSVHVSRINGLTQHLENISLIYQWQLIIYFTYSQGSLKHSFPLIFHGVRFISMTTLKSKIMLI